MDQESKKRFDELAKRDPASLTPADVAFIRARESYLSPAQRETFSDLLGLREKKKADDPKPLEELSDKELAKLAKSLDLDPKDFDEPEQLIAAIREKQAAQ